MLFESHDLFRGLFINVEIYSTNSTCDNHLKARQRNRLLNKDNLILIFATLYDLDGNVEKL